MGLAQRGLRLNTATFRPRCQSSTSWPSTSWLAFSLAASLSGHSRSTAPLKWPDTLCNRSFGPLGTEITPVFLLFLYLHSPLKFQTRPLTFSKPATRGRNRPAAMLRLEHNMNKCRAAKRWNAENIFGWD